MRRAEGGDEIEHGGRIGHGLAFHFHEHVALTHAGAVGRPAQHVAMSAALHAELEGFEIAGVISWTSTPIQPRVTPPDFTICSSTIFAVDTGIAKPMPIEPPEREKIAVLMPTRLPPASMSAPPELPGLMAASVWMKFSNVLMPSPVRPSATQCHRSPSGPRRTDCRSRAPRHPP